METISVPIFPAQLLLLTLPRAGEPIKIKPNPWITVQTLLCPSTFLRASKFNKDLANVSLNPAANALPTITTDTYAVLLLPKFYSRNITFLHASTVQFLNQNKASPTVIGVSYCTLADYGNE